MYENTLIFKGIGYSTEAQITFECMESDNYKAGTLTVPLKASYPLLPMVTYGFGSTVTSIDGVDGEVYGGEFFICPNYANLVEGTYYNINLLMGDTFGFYCDGYKIDHLCYFEDVGWYWFNDDHNLLMDPIYRIISPFSSYELISVMFNTTALRHNAYDTYASVTKDGTEVTFSECSAFRITWYDIKANYPDNTYPS